MSTNQHNNVDNLDNLLDLSEYDNMGAFPSPSLSPSTVNKNQFPARPSVSHIQTPSLSSISQPSMSGPSHQYDLYKQQTGIVPGALASTLAVNQANVHISGYNSGFGMDYLNGMSPETELFDFNAAPNGHSQNSSHLDMDMDFDASTDNQFFFHGTDTINPSAIGGQDSPVVSSQPNNVGRLWPGMHTQAAAMAKAQQQRQHVLHSQSRQQPQPQQQLPQQSRSRTRSAQPTDPIVEQKITQLLNSMRAKSSSEDGSPTPMVNLPRSKKDEDDMDEDERLLASEEGKKLSSKERRQLRNKVSARAFRSRRKEYITQLEAEIANKVTENGELRTENRALADENKRLSDLTRMLLSSSSFSSFLDTLSTTPPQQQSSQPAVKPEQSQTEQPLPTKDVNPFAAQQAQQQQIGMAMIPEHNMDMSMLNLSADAFTYQPRVYAVLETPEMPATIETEMLSGKTSNFVGQSFDSDDEKGTLPAIESHKSLSAPQQAPSKADKVEEVYDDDFENDPEFALYHSTPATQSSTCPSELDTDGFSQVDLFGGIEPEKVLARYQLVDASVEEEAAVVALVKVQRISAHLDPVLARLESMCL